jgi:hypothetical protein
MHSSGNYAKPMEVVICLPFNDKLRRNVGVFNIASVSCLGTCIWELRVLLNEQFEFYENVCSPNYEILCFSDTHIYGHILFSGCTFAWRQSFNCRFRIQFFFSEADVIWNSVKNAGWLEYLHVIVLNYSFVITVFPVV